MKKIYFLLTFLFAVAISYAQPTLTEANSAPVIGQSFERKAFAPANGQEGSAGVNQTWDWSTLEEDFYTIGDYVSPVGTAHAADHPTATTCLVMGDVTEYDRSDNTGIYRLAFYNPNQLIEQVYDVPTKFLSYPFSLNSTYTTSYHANIVGDGFSGTQAGDMTVTADAWGTLITPAGTFTNVLRIHAHAVEVIDYGALGVFHQTADQYLFMTPGIHYPIGSVIWGESEGSPYSGGTWSTAAVGINELNVELYRLSVYPNPVNESASFSYTLSEFSSVSVNVMDQTGRIVQKSGEEMMQHGKHTFDVDAANLPNGIYFLQAIINDETASIRMLVNH